MKIAIDCRTLGNSGIGVYLREILKYILKEDAEFLLIGDIEKLKKYSSKNIKILDCKIKPFSLGEILSFPRKEINKYDSFYSPNFNIPYGLKINIFSTIHDVVFLDVDGVVSQIGRLIRKYYLSRALKVSKKIFTVSKFSKKRISYHFGKEDKIIIGYNGISSYLKESIKTSEIDILKKYKLNTKGYIIYVGNIKKHKGLKTLLEATNDILDEKLKLVIVGENKNFKTSDKKIEKILLKNKNKNIIFTGRVLDEELKILLKNSKTLIQPSLYEGFGIPPLEALYLGVKPIISDIEVFKELYLNLPVVFFKVGDKKDLKTQIKKYEPQYQKENVKLMKEFDYKNTSKIIYDTILK